MDGQAILLRENQVGTQTTKSTVWSQSIDENGDKHITQALQKPSGAEPASAAGIGCCALKHFALNSFGLYLP